MCTFRKVCIAINYSSIIQVNQLIIIELINNFHPYLEWYKIQVNFDSKIGSVGK